MIYINSTEVFYLIEGFYEALIFQRKPLWSSTIIFKPLTVVLFSIEVSYSGLLFSRRSLRRFPVLQKTPVESFYMMESPCESLIF